MHPRYLASHTSPHLLPLLCPQALPDLDPSEVEKLFYALDLNRTGTVDVKEFFASLLHTMAPENQVCGEKGGKGRCVRGHSCADVKEFFANLLHTMAPENQVCEEGGGGERCEGRVYVILVLQV